MKIQTVAEILRLLEREGGLTISGIAKQLGISRRTASRYVYTLARMGLVEIREYGRALYVRATPEARALTRAIPILYPEIRVV